MDLREQLTAYRHRIADPIRRRTFLRFVAERSPMLAGTVMRVGERWLVDLDYDSVDAEPWLHFTASEADGDARLALSHVDPDADFSYDYADLDFQRTQACH